MGGNTMTVTTTWNPEGVAWLSLDSPPGNILDLEMMGDLSNAMTELEEGKHRPYAVILRGAGGNFCYGASVEEHLPDKVEEMLFHFTELLRQMVAFPAVTIAAVSGKALGGGYELALGCDRLILDTNAVVGLPEIRLGVFPPAGLALLPLRAGDGTVADAVLSGRLIGAEEAVQKRLADVLTTDVEKEILQWLEGGVLHHSRASLRVAIDRMRRRRRDVLESELPKLHRMYLHELTQFHDGEEGIRAFCEKRKPEWDHIDFVK